MSGESKDKVANSEQQMNASELLHESDDKTINLTPDSSIATDSEATGKAVGSVIRDHYRLESRIGSGGSSAVFLATDLLLSRKVAVKLLLSGVYYSDEERMRFQREGRAVGSLDHPHIVKIFEFNTTKNDEPFLVMEYLEGESLADLIKARGKIQVQDLITFVSQIAGALAYAHRKGIVHRDIKSSNIVLTQDISGERIAKLVDFGLAKPEEEAGRGLTLTGTIFGSPYYMSPEQCKGEKIDARSDIYSLGCVMYECLTGTVPFTGASLLDTFRMHIEEQPWPIAAKLKGIKNAAQIEKVVFKCLAKNRSDRYQTAEGLEVDLKDLEKRTRSSTADSALSFLRGYTAGTRLLAGKHPRLLLMILLPLFGLAVFLCLRPQTISDPADCYWGACDLEAQQAFDRGDYETAAKEYARGLEIAQTLPVSRRKERQKESLLGALELSILLKQKERVNAIRGKLESLRKSMPESKDAILVKSLPSFLMELNERNKSTTDKRSISSEAASFLTRANEAAEVMIDDGRLREAGELLKKAYDGTSSLIPENDKIVPRSLFNLVSITINTDPLGAVKYLFRCQSLVDNSTELPLLAKAKLLSDLARNYIVAQQLQLAEDQLEKAMEIYGTQTALSGASASEAYVRLAEVQLRTGKTAAAAISLEQAKNAISGIENPPQDDIVRMAHARAELLIRTGKRKEGLDLLQQQLTLQEKKFPKSYFELNETLYWYANLLMNCGPENQSEQKIDALTARCCAIFERMEQSTFASDFWHALGKYQAKNGKLVNAEKSMLRALEQLDSMPSTNSFSKLLFLNNLGEILMRKGEYQRAYKTLKNAEALQREIKTKNIRGGLFINITGNSSQFLYQHLAECANKLGMREENRKYRELTESNF